MGRRRKIDKVVTEMTITGIADKGKAVGRDENGQVIFVKDVVPGDVVDVKVIRKRKKYMEAIPTHFHKYSDDRVEPFCEYFGVCGGCKWQNLAYEAQLRHKAQHVEDVMTRIGKIEIGKILPLIPADKTSFYRNKLEFSFCNKRWLTPEELNTDVSNVEDVLGFHKAGAWDKIVNIDKCHLQEDPSNAIRNAAKQIGIDQGLEFFDARAQTGSLRNMIIRVTTLGQVMVIMVYNDPDEAKRTAHLDELYRQFPTITSLNYCINTKANDFIMDLDIVLYQGVGYIEEKMGDVQFRIGPKSFFQTNTLQAIRLYDQVAAFANLTGTENVYDLYTGIGSIALYLAHQCKQVVGIEEIEMAIKDAAVNAEINNIDNAVFYAGDVKDILTEDFAKKHGKADVIITDPPRSGMHAKVVNMLLELEAPHIVYVSCNPATQARDMNLLKEKYEVEKIQAVDMFPQTHHLESIALLTLKQ